MKLEKEHRKCREREVATGQVANFLVLNRITRPPETVIFIFLYFPHMLTPKRGFIKFEIPRNDYIANPLLTPNM